MDIRAELNVFYKPLHQKGRKALSIIRGLGFNAKFGYYNLHEVLIEGEYQTEYFPLPEIKISGAGQSADLGISLDGTAWLEITIKKETALSVCYSKLLETYNFEIYGANDYLTDFYHAGMDCGNISHLIENSAEDEIHVCFKITELNAEYIERLITALSEYKILSLVNPAAE